MDDNSIKNFIATCEELASLNLEIGPSGNLSFRAKDDDLVIITPTGSRYEEISNTFFAKQSFSESDSNDSVKPSSDIRAHVEIYEARDDVRAIV